MTKTVKIILVAAAGVVVLAAAAAVLFLVPWGVTAPIDEAQAATLQAQRTEATDSDTLTTLRINGVPAIYDSVNNVFYYTLSKSENWERLSFAAGEQDGSAAAPLEDYRALEKERVLTKGTGVPVMLYDGERYRKSAVMFSSLPILSIETQQLPEDLHYEDEAETLAEWQATHEQDETPPDDHAQPSTDKDKPIDEQNVYAKITLLDAEAGKHGYENGYTSKARLHVRGRSSAQYPKNSYKLELLKKDDNDPTVLTEKKDTLLGMRNDGDWNLNGMYAEATKLRDKLASDVWLAMNQDQTARGVSNGWSTEYIEVVINGRYWGLYLLGERIDKKQMGLADGDYMYFSEADVGKKWSDFVDVGDQAAVKGYELSYPLPMTEPYNEWQAFADMTKFIQIGDTDSKEKVDEVINTDSLINYWIYVQSVFGVDNLIQNTYYISYASDNGRFSFVPWDMDQTFGWGWTDEPPLKTGERYLDSNDWLLDFWVSSGLIRSNPGDFNEAIDTRYQALRKDVLSTAALTERMRGYHDEILDSGAFARNQSRWPDGAYDKDTTELTRFITTHMGYLDSAIPAMSGKTTQTTRLWR